MRVGGDHRAGDMALRRPAVKIQLHIVAERLHGLFDRLRAFVAGTVRARRGKRTELIQYAQGQGRIRHADALRTPAAGWH